jgi:Protein kinase domain
MPLAPGSRVGPYEIVGPVGAGGMGEVYRATDTRLGRTVAVKVLWPRLASDPDQRARFEREARAVSSLNHPHICTLYDVGQTGDTQYLVLEYLDGETLAARVARGPLPLDQALRFGIEICDGLDRAHRQGLTHRDLKPANVMLTSSGTKLLDFGLAKPRAVVAAASNDAATQVGPVTTEGTILGTIEYMAPEQVEGREADARSDIWAFGCLLYEMVAGARPFHGPTPASVVAAILEREPAPPARGIGSLPPRLWDVICTCLQKNPEDRWQSARDLARELTWCARSSDTAALGVAAPAVPPPHAATSRRAWLAIAAVSVIAVAVPGAWLATRPSGAAAPAGPPVIVLMDSTHPERIYDEQTRKAGGTNADDLTDVLRDLPVRLVKENTNASWHREYEVLQENPALIVAHRSCFYDATMLGEASRQVAFINLSWDKFELFAGLVAQANSRTKILSYSRGSWADEPARAKWIASMEQRFPPLKGRVEAMRVPLDRATFRNPATAADIRKLVVALLALKN